MRIAIAICAFFLFFAPVASADIFKYVDDQGVICYTDTPAGKKADRIHKDTPETPSGQKQPVQYNSGVNANASEYHNIIHEKASMYDLDPSLIKAVIKTESNWNSRAVSRKGAMGLMQLMPATATEMNVQNPYDPEENIEGGTKYLRYLLERFNGDLTLALAAYNAGPKTVEKFGYVPPITETKHYVSKVLSLYNGQTILPSVTSESGKSKKKYEPIYKVLLNDGSLLFTNSSLISKNPVRF
ncbi:MAG: lytic transglycosylase domain-containing protein [Thermodesulfovibrionales bacterium]|nr:lytic transglycosylase domain-containing protein [Thermodesulfovibrionales bacterium]